jgi:hypothetical protein
LSRPGNTSIIGVSLAADDGDGSGSINGGPDQLQCTFTKKAPSGSGIQIIHVITATVQTAGGSTAFHADSTTVTIN